MMYSANPKKSSALRMTFAVLVSLVFTLPVQAHNHGTPGPVKPPHGPRIFYRSSLPHHAMFSIIAGITYAVIDGQYYRQQGNQYIYVATPPTPPQTTVIVQPATSTVAAPTTSNSSSQSLLEPGTIVSQLPAGASTITINKRLFYVSNHTWYLPLNDHQGYVVVKPQL